MNAIYEIGKYKKAVFFKYTGGEKLGRREDSERGRIMKK